MIKLYERYNTGDNATTTVYGANWVSQTFTPGTAHKVAQFRLKLIAVGNCGTITVSLQATSGGFPDGTDLITKTVAQGDLPTGDADWVDVDFATFQRVDNELYAIVIRALTGDAGNYLGVRYDSSASYSGGGLLTSSDSGGSWLADIPSVKDIMFEDWGEPVTQPQDTITLYLVPAGSGTYTELSGFSWDWSPDHGNWELVDDPWDAPDEHSSFVGNHPYNSEFPSGTLTGTVTWTNASKAVTGSGTAFESELEPGIYIRSPDDEDYIAKVASIQSDTELTLVANYGGESGADTADETEYCNTSKKDSYTIKPTKMQGTISGVAVIYRCVNARSIFYTGTDGYATPFLRLDSTDLTGTKQTIPNHTITSWRVYPWVTYKEAFTSRPSGGVWSWDDFSSLEVGVDIEFAYYDQSNFNAVLCTQAIVAVTVTPMAGALRPSIHDQFTEHGLRCFDGSTEFGHMIADDYFTSFGRAVDEFIIDFVADPVSGSRKSAHSINRYRKSNRVVPSIRKSNEPE